MSEDNFNISKNHQEQNTQHSAPQPAPAFQKTIIDHPTQLPYSTASLVLGILSIVLSCCSFVGVVLGIIALVQAKKATDEWYSNQKLYTESSFKNANAGKICAIIGLCISGLALLYWITYIFLLKTIFAPIFESVTSGGYSI